MLDSEYDSFMAELDGGGGGGRANSKPEVILITGEEKVTPLPTSSIPTLTTTSSSQSFGSLSAERSYSNPPIDVNVGMPQIPQKRQQTIIVVTTVLTGVGVSISNTYNSQHMSAPPAISYATASHNVAAPMSVASSISAPWNMPPQPQQPHYHPPAPHHMNYPPPANHNGFYQQPQHQAPAPAPWGFNNMPNNMPPPPIASIPPPPPAEVTPLPPPPGPAQPYFPQQPHLNYMNRR